MRRKPQKWLLLPDLQGTLEADYIFKGEADYISCHLPLSKHLVAKLLRWDLFWNDCLYPRELCRELSKVAQPPRQGKLLSILNRLSDIMTNQTYDHEMTIRNWYERVNMKMLKKQSHSTSHLPGRESPSLSKTSFSWALLIQQVQNLSVGENCSKRCKPKTCCL